MEILQTQQSIERSLRAARAAQRDWRLASPRERASKARNVAALIADRCKQLCQAIESPVRRDARETTAVEVLPLADAARWLAKRAPRILVDRWLGMSDLPLWLGRLSSNVQRSPRGVVLILGAGNYPLFLAGVQMLQGLVAGNAVVYKPAPGCEGIASLWCQLLIDAGFPKELIVLLGADPVYASYAVNEGVDHVVATGSSATGRTVLKGLLPSLASSTMELSGCDAMIVLASANVKRVVRAIAFGLQMNSSATCLAPRRIFVARELYSSVEMELKKSLEKIPAVKCPVGVVERMVKLVDRAIEEGAVYVSQPNAIASSSPDDNHLAIRPIVLKDVDPNSSLAKQDLFAPIAMLIPFEHRADVVEMQDVCPYALTASVFGEEHESEWIADRLEVGTVTINDVIAPTADPRVPFGGVKESGFGVTRGREGLLEMTRAKTVIRRRGKWLPHLDPPEAGDGELIEGVLLALHGENWYKRWQGLQGIWRGVQLRRTSEGKRDTVDQK